MNATATSRALPLVGSTPRRPEPPITALADAIERAALAAGLSPKSLYGGIGLDKGNWSKALSSGNVPLGKLLMLAQFPPSTPEGQFWSAFRPELDALIGQPAQTKAAIVREALQAVSQLVVAFTCQDDERRSA